MMHVVKIQWYDISVYYGLASKAGSKTLEHRPNKRMTYTLQKQVNKKALLNKREPVDRATKNAAKCRGHLTTQVKAPTLSPIFLMVNYRSKASRKYNPQNRSMLSLNRQKDIRVELVFLTNVFKITWFWCTECLSALETWPITGLDVTLAAPRKGSFDSGDECKYQSRNNNLSQLMSAINPLLRPESC